MVRTHPGSLREGAGNGLYYSTCRPKAATLRAIFIAPTKLRSFYISPFIGGHSLSQLRCQLPQRGSRERAVPFNVPPKSRNVAGDFHRPYETLMILDFTIHRRTLPQLRCAQQLPQRGSRDWLYHSPSRPETATLRAIFIAPTKLKSFYISPFITPKNTFFQNGRRNSYESC